MGTYSVILPCEQFCSNLSDFHVIQLNESIPLSLDLWSSASSLALFRVAKLHENDHLHMPAWYKTLNSSKIVKIYHLFLCLVLELNMFFVHVLLFLSAILACAWYSLSTPTLNAGIFCILPSKFCPIVPHLLHLTDLLNNKAVGPSIVSHSDSIIEKSLCICICRFISL